MSLRSRLLPQMIGALCFLGLALLVPAGSFKFWAGVGVPQHLVDPRTFLRRLFLQTRYGICETAAGNRRESGRTKTPDENGLPDFRRRGASCTARQRRTPLHSGPCSSYTKRSPAITPTDFFFVSAIRSFQMKWMSRKFRYAHANFDPNRMTQFLIATVAGLQVRRFTCAIGWNPTITADICLTLKYRS